MINSPGVYEISHDEYHGDSFIAPVLSRSTIYDLLYKSPAHAIFNHPALNKDYKPETEKGKFDLGLSCHALLLEGIDNVVVIEADDWRTKAAKEERDRAWSEGKNPLLAKQYEEVKKIVEKAEKNILACKELGIKDLRKDGKSELSYVWKEGETWLKVRPDWLANDKKIILDCKFTGNSANPDDLARHILSMGYDIQNSLYRRGVKALDGIEPKFIFFFQEIVEPYLCSFVGLPPQWVEMGKSKVEYGKFLWEQCLESGKWPGYPDKVCWIEPPAWGLAAWEQKAQEIGI